LARRARLPGLTLLRRRPSGPSDLPRSLLERRLGVRHVALQLPVTLGLAGRIRGARERVGRCPALLR
jgi:hypothetical protein